MNESEEGGQSLREEKQPSKIQPKVSQSSNTNTGPAQLKQTAAKSSIDKSYLIRL